MPCRVPCRKSSRVPSGVPCRVPYLVPCRVPCRVPRWYGTGRSTGTARSAAWLVAWHTAWHGAWREHGTRHGTRHAVDVSAGRGAHAGLTGTSSIRRMTMSSWKALSKSFSAGSDSPRAGSKLPILRSRRAMKERSCCASTKSHSALVWPLSCNRSHAHVLRPQERGVAWGASVQSVLIGNWKILLFSIGVLAKKIRFGLVYSTPRLVELAGQEWTLWAVDVAAFQV